MSEVQLDLFAVSPAPPPPPPLVLEPETPEPEPGPELPLEARAPDPDPGQGGLFGDLPVPKAGAEPVKRLLVHFEQFEDVTAFAGLVGQHVTTQTRIISFPPIIEVARAA